MVGSCVVSRHHTRTQVPEREWHLPHQTEKTDTDSGEGWGKLREGYWNRRQKSSNERSDIVGLRCLILNSKYAMQLNHNITLYKLKVTINELITALPSTIAIILTAYHYPAIHTHHVYCEGRTSFAIPALLRITRWTLRRTSRIGRRLGDPIVEWPSEIPRLTPQ